MILCGWVAAAARVYFNGVGGGPTSSFHCSADVPEAQLRVRMYFQEGPRDLKLVFPCSLTFFLLLESRNGGYILEWKSR